ITNRDKYLAALSTTIERLEAKIDSLETTRPSGLNTVKKLAPENMPGPRRPNNLLNCQDLQPVDLSGADTPTFELYVKSIWPEALSSGEVNEELRLSKNATHRFSCIFWPSRIVGNLSGDFDTVAKFIRYKNPSWLLTIEAILTIMRNYNGVQPPISQLASIRKNSDEGDLQFLRRVRSIFNRMPLSMADSSVTHEVLKHTLRQYVPKLWARVEDRGLANQVFATEEERLLALENTDIEDNLCSAEDDYLQTYIHKEFNDRKEQDLELDDQEGGDTIYLAKDHDKENTRCLTDREGLNQSHPLFKAIFMGIVEPATFNSSNPTNIKGLGHKPAAEIKRDSTVNVKLPSGENLGSICSGVVPDNLFPGQLVLGRSLFHVLGIYTKENGTVQLFKIDNLSEIDLQAIFEAFRDQTRLPSRLAKFTGDFISRNNRLFFIDGKILRDVSNYDFLLGEAVKIHQKMGHSTAGILISELRKHYWHPDMVLVGQEAIRTYERCQLTLSPNIPSIPLQPIPPALPLQRWGIDFTGPILGYYLLNSIDYATGYAISQLCLNTNHKTIINFINNLVYVFGIPFEMISDNGSSF
ncbi:hypothetical protein EPUL_005307, partial [Erysiphe pulchra]